MGTIMEVGAISQSKLQSMQIMKLLGFLEGFICANHEFY